MMPLYRYGRKAARLLFHFFLPYKITGLEHIPSQGRAVIACNHILWFDPGLVAMTTNRQIFFMSKIELFQNALLGFLLRKIGCFPVQRGTADMAAIKKALTLLKDEQILGIFPEGTRNKSGELQALMGGAVMIAVKAKAPLIPMMIVGPVRWFHTVRLVVGEPVALEEFYQQRLDGETVEKAALLLRDAMQRLAQSV